MPVFGTYTGRSDLVEYCVCLLFAVVSVGLYNDGLFFVFEWFRFFNNRLTELESWVNLSSMENKREKKTTTKIPIRMLELRIALSLIIEIGIKIIQSKFLVRLNLLIAM